jgi:hypothetical protein
MCRALLQDVELMPQHQDFSFKSSSRLETVAQHADKRKAIANIQQSCSDSPGFANPMDGVFVTDTRWCPPQSDVELMAEKQIIGLKPAPRLKQVGDEHSERVQDCKHRS